MEERAEEGERLRPSQDELRVRVSADPEFWTTIPEGALWLSDILRQQIRQYRARYNDRPDIVLANVADNLVPAILMWLNHRHPAAQQYTQLHNPRDYPREVDVPAPESEWCQQFFSRYAEIVPGLMVAASRLSLATLGVCCGEFLAKRMRGDTPEEFARQFGIGCDLSQEDYDQILAQNATLYFR